MDPLSAQLVRNLGALTRARELGENVGTWEAEIEEVVGLLMTEILSGRLPGVPKNVTCHAEGVTKIATQGNHAETAPARG